MCVMPPLNHALKPTNHPTGEWAKKTMRDERLNPSHPIRHFRRLVPVGGVDRVCDLTGCLDSRSTTRPHAQP